MDLFRHHAYLSAGDIPAVTDGVRALLERAGIVFLGNPDVLAVTAHSLGIDEARGIFEHTRVSVPPESRRIVLVSCVQATVEAQNALLKLAEEPPRRTHFFFIVPNEDVLLPTLRSRLQKLPVEMSGEGSDVPDAKYFLSASFQKRMELVSDWIEEKQHDRALSLLNGLEEHLSDDPVRHRDALHAIETARGYLLRRGSSLKLVLEYLALSVPKIL
ncbi:MAG: hypothetical protein AMXMBFR44_3650 [Candidatus Campbellbacteria bacterium]